MTLEVQGERFTLRAKDVPLTVILEQLARAADITVHLRAAVEERLSVELTNGELAEGLGTPCSTGTVWCSLSTSGGRHRSSMCCDLRRGMLVPRRAEPSEAPVAAAAPEHDSAVDVEAETVTTAQIIEAFEADSRVIGGRSIRGDARLLRSPRPTPSSPCASLRCTGWWIGERQASMLGVGMEGSRSSVQSVAMQVLL